MPLLERVRVEAYLPDLPSSEYQNLLRSFEEEFTYAFGGCSIVRGLEGSYLSDSGDRIPDRINLIFSDDIRIDLIFHSFYRDVVLTS